MSIDARVSSVDYLSDGTVRLGLEPSGPGAIAGQDELIVENPASDMQSIVGTQIWGSSNCIMVGQIRWADRVGYTRVRLLPKKK